MIMQLENLVKAYELWMGSELNLKQVAKALDLNYKQLYFAIMRAEQNGLSSYKTAAHKAADLVAAHPGITIVEIADIAGWSTSHATRSLSQAKRKSLVIRRRMMSDKRFAVYFPVAA